MFIFFLISCKKDKKDTLPPSITCTAPSSGQHVKMFDTLTVSATVTDDQHLSFINVTLTDLNHTPLQPSQPIHIQSASFSFSIKYILTQYHLETGNYFIQITADDGYNTVSFYQPIFIVESPTQLWGYCTVLKNTSTTINFVDTANAPLSSLVLSHAYNGIKYGAYYQQLYVNGKGTQAFQSFNVQATSINQTVNYTATATVNQVDYTSLYTDGTRPYVGFLNSDVNSFDNMGAYGISYRLNDMNYYPYLFTKTSNYGVGVFKSKIAANSDKIVAFSSFGAFYNSLGLPSPNFKVIAIFEKGTDGVCVLGNDASNQAQGYIYNIIDGSSTPLTGLPVSGKILSAVKVNNNYMAFSTSSNTYLYCYSTPSNNISLPFSAQKLAYQPKLNRLVAAVGFNLNSYYVGTDTLTSISGTHSSINCGDSIVDFEVITNK
ncbi:MAG TPA: hypothetical protein VK835_12360 [Bacteroidia bacterium]|nr:hypothetical protein [Bacteroidia bacterium]